MKVYYAHSLHLYSKPQEARDIALLTDLGFTVINPSAQVHVDMCNEIRSRCDTYDEGSAEIMNYFMDVVDGCSIIAFRAHPDGKIPSGVGMEVRRGIEKGKKIIELPTLLNSRFMEKAETRQYLELLGER